MKYSYELTDLFGGESNYSWVKRGVVSMPDLTHYGYDGSQCYSRSNKIFERELIKKVKRELGITERHKKESYGEIIELRFDCTILFIEWME
jgi:hypothetical protein